MYQNKRGGVGMKPTPPRFVHFHGIAYTHNSLDQMAWKPSDISHYYNKIRKIQ